MKGKILTLVIILAILIASCSQKKKQYYYASDGGTLELIEEFSDSAAYMHAFKRFHVYKKLIDGIDYGMKDNPYYMPKYAKYYNLFNAKYEDITDIVHFSNEDSLKADAIVLAEKIASDDDTEK